MQRPIDRNNERNKQRAEDSARCGYRLVFWDWNGTLLDDRDYAMAVRNRVFPRFGLPTVKSVEEYHRHFTFPVRLYYEQAGVTRENFVEVANAWMGEYMRGCGEIPLQEGARQALEAFRQAGLSQVVLSASQVDILRQQLEQYGLGGYFQETLGLGHIYATSKEAIGKEYLERTPLSPKACVMLGDTLHDAQVAKEMGVDCLLISRGHQSRESLGQAGIKVCGSLEEAVAQVLLGPGSLDLEAERE